MATIATLRTTYLNVYLGRTDGSTEPWADGDCDRHLTDAIVALWPNVAKRASGTVATSQDSDTYAVPTGVTRVSRIDLLDSAGNVVGDVTDWRYLDDTHVIIRPLLVDGLTLRFGGWVAYASTGSDLPTTLEVPVAMRAAGLAFSELAGHLVNYQRQQGLDSGRVVDYGTAIGLSSYWMTQSGNLLAQQPQVTSYAPRRSRR